MKKILLVTAIASISLASCVNDEAANPQNFLKQKIVFDTPVLYNNESRAIEYGEIGPNTDKPIYPSTEQFIIYANSYEGAFAGWSAANDAEFSGTAIAYVDDVNGWAPKNGDKYYYWESGKKMAFAACSPADLEQDATWTEAKRYYGATGLTIEDFVIASEPEKQFDLMFSTRTCDHESTPTTTNGSYNGVPIQFQHALSAIHFAVKNESEEETVVLKSIKILDVNYKGTFCENITEDGTKYVRDVNVSPEWDTTSDVTTYTAYADASGYTFTSDLTTLDSAMLLMPQDLSDDAQLEIIYTVNDKERTKYVPLNTLSSTSKGTISSWELGTRYTYCLHYKAQGKIFFAPSVDEWIDIDDIVINL